MSKILITGAKGLVGSAIPISMDNVLLVPKRSDMDLMNEQDTWSYISYHKPDSVIHCAAKVGGLAGNMNHMGEFFYENMLMTTQLIELCRQAGVKKVLSFLSTCIFPDKAEYPLTEDQILLGPPHESNYGYAYAKRMTYIQSCAYRQQYGMNCICVVPTNIYGPRDNYDLDNGHVLPSLIHKCYLAKQNKTEFVVWGSGAPLREFIFSEDIGKLVLKLLEDYNEEEPIILTTGDEIPIGVVAGLVAKAMGYKGKIKFDTSKPDGQFRKPSSNAKLMALYPDFKFTPIEIGIQRAVDWFCHNYPNVRGA